MNAQTYLVNGKRYIHQEIPESLRELLRERVRQATQAEKPKLASAKTAKSLK